MGKDRLFLLCADVNTEIDIKKLSTRMGVKANAPMRLADEDVFQKVLQVSKGSVNPFVMANKYAKGSGGKHGVYLLLDKCSFQGDPNSLLLFHPMRNDYTTSISCADLQKFLDETSGRNSYQFVDLNADEAISLEVQSDSGAELPGRAASTERGFAQAGSKVEKSLITPRDKIKKQMFARDHIFTNKKPEETLFHRAFLKREYVV